MDLWIRPEGWLRWFAHPLALCAGIAPSTSAVAVGLLSFCMLPFIICPRLELWLQFSQSFRLCNSMDCYTPGFPVLHCLLEFAQTHVPELVLPSNHLFLCCPLLLMPSIFSRIRVFCNESALRIKWPKYCIFSFSVSPSNVYSEWISFRIDWFGLLAVQGTLKSLLQQYSLKASLALSFLWFNSHIPT